MTGIPQFTTTIQFYPVHVPPMAFYRGSAVCVCTHASLDHAGTGVLHSRRRTTTSTSLIEIFTSLTRILVVKFRGYLHACSNMCVCRYLDACSDMHPVVKSQ